jgi:hypothetical protein
LPASDHQTCFVVVAVLSPEPRETTEIVPTEQRRAGSAALRFLRMQA